MGGLNYLLSQMRISIMIKIFYLITGLAFLSSCHQSTSQYYVSMEGDDSNKGSQSAPFRTIKKAKSEIKEKKRELGNTFEIIIDKGTYYLKAPLKFGPEESGTAESPYIIRAKKEEKVVLSAGVPLDLSWKKYNKHIWRASVKNLDSIPALYTDKERLIPARYPNDQKGKYPFGGYAKDALSPKRISNWSDPSGGYIHAMHKGRWGSKHYRITGKIGEDSLQYKGGWQINRRGSMHPVQRYVDHIFEELDAPGEWFFDRDSKKLYYYPKSDENPQDMNFIAANLEAIIQLHGSEDNPVENINLEGLEFAHTAPTFMKTKEPLMRSDWSIYRNGAVFLEGTKNCTIQNSTFHLLGGNAIFGSGYNEKDKIENNLIEDIGASGIAFVGLPKAVRSPSFRYDEFVPPEKMDTVSGPKTSDYPHNCIARNNLIRHIGIIEKQVAGIEIQMASTINIIHNTIYNVPRAGINIGDGAWGGHDISYNDVFKTVLETNDHGAFNSWGRDRYWRSNRKYMDSLVQVHRDWILLDAKETTFIHDNRFRADNGWDIDLDDGSSNYEIYNNLCLSGGIKLREGFYRKVYNNIVINNGFHPHVWFKNSKDIFRNNFVMAKHEPIGMDYWGKRVDHNIFTNKTALLASQRKGTDSNSVWIDEPSFKNPKKGNFSFCAGSPVLDEGFQNIDFSQVGVTSPRLKKLIDSPKIPKLSLTPEGRHKNTLSNWHKAEIKNIETLGEQSAAGLNEPKGVLILDIKDGSPLEKAGFQKKDVILEYSGDEIADIPSLKKAESKTPKNKKIQFIIWRDQHKKTIEITF